MEKEAVFQECHKMPLWCKCGCNSFDRLFTHEAQQRNYDSKGSYRVFANCSHRDNYFKKLKCP